MGKTCLLIIHRQMHLQQVLYICSLQGAISVYFQWKIIALFILFYMQELFYVKINFKKCHKSLKNHRQTKKCKIFKYIPTNFNNIHTTLQQQKKSLYMVLVTALQFIKHKFVRKHECD